MILLRRPPFVLLRFFPLEAWYIVIAGFLAGMAILLALDYDVDIGGGIGWASFWVRAGVGLSVFAASIPFGALVGICQNSGHGGNSGQKLRL